MCPYPWWIGKHSNTDRDVIKKQHAQLTGGCATVIWSILRKHAANGLFYRGLFINLYNSASKTGDLQVPLLGIGLMLVNEITKSCT